MSVLMQPHVRPRFDRSSTGRFVGIIAYRRDISEVVITPPAVAGT
jgi:hypothetical protein